MCIYPCHSYCLADMLNYLHVVKNYTLASTTVELELWSRILYLLHSPVLSPVFLPWQQHRNLLYPNQYQILLLELLPICIKCKYKDNETERHNLALSTDAYACLFPVMVWLLQLSNIETCNRTNCVSRDCQYPVLVIPCFIMRLIAQPTPLVRLGIFPRGWACQ